MAMAPTIVDEQIDAHQEALATLGNTIERLQADVRYWRRKALFYEARLSHLAVLQGAERCLLRPPCDPDRSPGK